MKRDATDGLAMVTMKLILTLSIFVHVLLGKREEVEPSTLLLICCATTHLRLLELGEVKSGSCGPLRLPPTASVSSAQPRFPPSHRRPLPSSPAPIVQAAHPASRALRVAARWPAATLDPRRSALDLAPVRGSRETRREWDRARGASRPLAGH